MTTIVKDDWAPTRSSVAPATLPKKYGEPTDRVDDQGRKTGLWVERREKGKHVTERRYREGLVDGAFRVFVDGKLAIEEDLRSVPGVSPHVLAGTLGGVGMPRFDLPGARAMNLGSLRVGVHRSWHRSGAQRFEVSYDELGCKHGVERTWDAEGVLLDECPYENGLRHGIRRELVRGRYVATPFEQGVPALDPRSAAALVERLAAASKDDSRGAGAISDVLRAAAPEDARAALVHSLIRTNQWPAFEGCCFEAIVFLGGLAGSFDGETGLRIVRAALACRHASLGSLDAWYYTGLDALAQRCYALDRDAEWAELEHSLAPSLAQGVCSVRARMGASLSTDARRAVLSTLVESIFDGIGFFRQPTALRTPTGEIAIVHPEQHVDGLRALIATFATEEEFVVRMLPRARTHDRPLAASAVALLGEPALATPKKTRDALQLLCATIAERAASEWRQEIDAFQRAHSGVDWAGPVVASLRELGSDEAERVVLRGLDPSAPSWAFALSIVGAAPTEAVLQHVAALLDARLPELALGDPALRRMASHLGAQRLPFCTSLLSALKDERVGLRRRLELALGADERDALDERFPELASVKKLEEWGPRVERLAARLDLPKVPIYVLERIVDEHDSDPPGRKEVQRSGGVPLGVDKERWPTLGGKAIRHILTLDLDLMPELRERGLATGRALSIFVPKTRAGDDVELGVVMALTEEQIARGQVFKGPGTKEPGRIHATRVLVPRAVFEDDADVGPEQREALMRLRRVVRSAPGQVLGEPFWLQGEPETVERIALGGFSLQFDERLAEIAPGGNGRLYVFTSGLLMQGH